MSAKCSYLCCDLQRPEDFLGKIYDEHQDIDMPTAMTSVGNILGVWDIYTIRVQNMLQLE
jgi:hypothetical protein